MPAFQLHLDEIPSAHETRVQNCGRYAVIVQQSTPVGTCYVRYIARCGSRFCWDCSQIKARSWQKKIIASFKNSHCIMVTLTFPSSAPDPVLSPLYYSRAWEHFLKRLRRRYPDLRFARIVELTANGRPHFHVLIDQYVPQKYVSWAFAHCGGGSIADCRYIQPGRAARYVTKYITKTYDPEGAAARFFFISRMRSISTSRGLYYSIPRVRAMSLIEKGHLDAIDYYMTAIANAHTLLFNSVLVDDPRAPPFVWIPDDGKINPKYSPKLSFALTYRHLQAWALDLDNLPDDPNIPLLFPGDLDEASVNELQGMLFPNL